MALRKDNKVKSNFSKITISLASPEELFSKTQVEKFKTRNHQLSYLQTRKDGLFCERIFGPVRIMNVHCGKYKRIRYKGIVCDRCGVEVTEKKVRRERMGHISIWLFL
jgi:DNA-directed RNA polymerase subunit beta'